MRPSPSRGCSATRTTRPTPYPGPAQRSRSRIRDSRYNWIHETTTELDELGTVSGEVALAANAPTGRYRGVARRVPAGGRVTTSFTVAEFRVPEFLVEVEAGAAEYVSRDNIDTEARADFYFGGAVRDAAVTWAARSSADDDSRRGLRGLLVLRVRLLRPHSHLRRSDTLRGRGAHGRLRHRALRSAGHAQRKAPAHARSRSAPP